MSPIRVLSTEVHWQPWSSRAFARAASEHKPVLLAVTVDWCRWCADMHRTSYADPVVATLINERFVPIRVDADERPDISERYSLGGWPTTAFLSPAGAILGGGTYVPAGSLGGVLARVLDAFSSQSDRWAGAVAVEAGEPAAGPIPDLDAVVASVFATFDAEHGGFGSQPKFPHAAPIALALDLFAESGDARLAEIVVTSLDAMGWRGLYDEGDGGFFRYSAARDWGSPHTEKLLDVNAALLRLYVDASLRLDVARFAERAADALRFTETWLADTADGGWHGAQAADDRYYAAPADERRTMTPPPVDARLFADSNAAMVSAALAASRAFDDAGLKAFALRSLERVLLAGYRPGGGAAHGVDGLTRVRGLLVDQVAMATANLDAFDASGNVVYQMMAEELARYALGRLWDEAGGGFFDCIVDDADAVGLMRQRLKPFTVNCDAARMLARLAVTCGEPEFAGFARRTLAAMAPRALAHGPLAAHYAIAVRQLGPDDKL